MGEAERRARTYAGKFFSKVEGQWWPAVAGYTAGFKRGELVERRRAWEAARKFYLSNTEKLKEPQDV